VEIVTEVLEVVSCGCGGDPSDKSAPSITCTGCTAQVHGATTRASGMLWNRMQERVQNLKACCKKATNQRDVESTDVQPLVKCEKCGRKFLNIGN